MDERQIYISQDEESLSMNFPSEIENINRAEEETRKFLDSVGLSAEAFSICLVMREGLTNAVKHGNQFNPQKFVKYALWFKNDILTMEIEDEGDGFDWQSYKAMRPSASVEHGRGIFIMRRYFSEYRYNKKGNKLILTKYCPGDRQATDDQARFLENLIQSILQSPDKIGEISRDDLFRVIERLFVQQNKLGVQNAELRHMQLKKKELQAENATGSESEERYRALFENNPIETITVDHEGRVTEYNLAKKKAGDRLPNIGDIMYRDYAAMHRRDMHTELMACIKSGTPKEFSELAYGHKTLHIRISPFSGGAIITSVDITPLKEAEKDLARLATAIEQAREEIVIIDIDGNIEYVNSEFLSKHNYTREEAIGTNLFKGKKPFYDKTFYEEIWNALEKGEPWTGRFSRDTTKQRREVEATISPVRDESGEIICYVSVSRDVTRETQLEEQLRHAQKMRSIGTLAGGIAHDFNNILGSITINAEMIDDDAPDGSEIKYSAEQILLASQRAKDLVNQILLFSRDSKTERKPLQISVVVKETLKMLRAMLPATIQISRSVPEDVGLIKGDPTQIQEVLMNLCNNSAYAMREQGGSLKIAVEDVTIKDDPRFSEVPAGDYVRLSVYDTGIGIPPEIKDRIFDPFFTMKQPGEGTGLGLSVTHGIVANHGGVLTVDSEYGKWTEFSIFFPKVGSSEPELVEKKGQDLPGGDENILLVDDEVLMTDVGEKMLGRLGYNIIVTNSGHEALEVFSEDPDYFDLVITDMTMPYLTGVDLAKKLMEIRSDVPIILCTGFNELITPEKARNLGIRKFIMKPFEMEKMAKAIRSAMGKTAQEQEDEA
ncbi:MAG: ATP-binding protein [Thermodesulfobacteriota bacterium]|nr:ATP-binding protein [Thermodesulfobacteriota bacterium]